MSKMRFKTSAPAVADGDTTENRCDAAGNLLVNTTGSTGAAAAAADGTANPTIFGQLAYLMGFNGTTWDRLRTAIVAKTATFTGILNTLALGRYNLTPPALTDGDAQLLQLDASGNLRQVVQNPAVAVDDTNGKIVVEHRYSFTNITLAAPTTTVVKSGAGLLHAITINTIGATGTITLWDNTAASGTKIGTITIPAAGAGDMPTSILFDVSFGTGLTVVTATAANDITVVYR